MMTSFLKQATIIGGRGFIGSAIAKYLEANGWECWIPEKDDPELFIKELGYVFYCAGLTADYLNRSHDVIDAHVSCLNKILHFSKYSSLVYLSSTRLYDSLSVAEANEDIDLCFNSANPRHIYDLSKALGEAMCFVGGKGKAKIARLSCVYCDHGDSNGFLSDLLRKIIDRRADQLVITVNSSPYFVRDYVSLDDVISALVLIVTSGTKTIYNVASGENILNREIFDFLGDFYKIKILPLKNEIPTISPAISISRMKEEFNWQPANLFNKLNSVLEKTNDFARPE